MKTPFSILLVAFLILSLSLANEKGGNKKGVHTEWTGNLPAADNLVNPGPGPKEKAVKKGLVFSRIGLLLGPIPPGVYGSRGGVSFAWVPLLDVTDI